MGRVCSFGWLCIVERLSNILWDPSPSVAVLLTGPHKHPQQALGFMMGGAAGIKANVEEVNM